MKKFKPIALTFITAAVLIMNSSLVFADDTQAATTPATDTSKANPKNFDDHKAKILQHIQDRLTKIQAIQTCVQASTDMKSLKACKPHGDKEDHDKDAGK